MADDSDQEKTEAATPRRLEKAREEGQVARSRELSTFMLLSCGIGGLWIMSGWLGGQLAEVMRTGLSFDKAQAFDTSRALSHSWMLGITAMKGLAPLMGLLVIVALVAPVLLGGWLFSTKAIKFDFKKLDPIKGVGRIFSSQAIAELTKTIAKTGLMGTVAAIFLYLHQGELLGLAGEASDGALIHALHLIAVCCAFVMLAFIGVVMIDVPYQLWSHHKKLRMSHEDIKQEHKESEGDPHVKGRIRQQQQAMARRRMMSQVPKADVIVTNPTHYAVALQYRDGEMSAPKLVAKGADEVAARIREIGREHNVPLLEAPPLARALYRHGELEHEIPAALYTAVAEVLAWVYQLKRYRQEGGFLPDTPTDIPVPPELDEGSATVMNDTP